MPRSFKRFDRALHNTARVEFCLALAAGSAAWSLACRGALPRPEHHLAPRARVEPGDRALPILNRN